VLASLKASGEAVPRRFSEIIGEIRDMSAAESQEMEPLRLSVKG
jgi:hypothetical protein